MVSSAMFVHRSSGSVQFRFWYLDYLFLSEFSRAVAERGENMLFLLRGSLKTEPNGQLLYDNAEETCQINIITKLTIL